MHVCMYKYVLLSQLKLKPNITTVYYINRVYSYIGTSCICFYIDFTEICTLLYHYNNHYIFMSN